MKAATHLHVEDSMQVDVTLTMTVYEMRQLLQCLLKNETWEVGRLRSVLRASLTKADAAYTCVEDVAP